METECLNAFIKAAEEVFYEIGFSALSFREARAADLSTEIIANVGITGDLQGYLIIYSDLPTASAIVEGMSANMGIDNAETDFGRFHKEAIGEIVNQISGRSTMFLSDLNYDCNITPPTVFIGNHLSYNIQDMENTILSNISGPFGSFALFAGLKKNKLKEHENS